MNSAVVVHEKSLKAKRMSCLLLGYENVMERNKSCFGTTREDYASECYVSLTDSNLYYQP